MINQQLLRQARVKVAALPKAKDIVDMDSTGGVLADYLASANWGGERAGRTQAMADAIGEDTTFGVRHPLLQTQGYALGGGLLGGLVGGLGSAGIAGLAGSPAMMDTAAGYGGLGGAGIGAILGALLAGKQRRAEMSRINHFYDQDAAAGKVSPKTPELSQLSAVLLPWRGPHRTGQVEAVEAMQGGSDIADQHGVGRDVLYALSRLRGPIGVGLRTLHGYGQNIKTRGRTGERDNRKPVEHVEPVRRPKTKAAAGPPLPAGALGGAGVSDDLLKRLAPPAPVAGQARAAVGADRVRGLHPSMSRFAATQPTSQRGVGYGFDREMRPGTYKGNSEQTYPGNPGESVFAIQHLVPGGPVGLLPGQIAVNRELGSNVVQYGTPSRGTGGIGDIRPPGAESRMQAIRDAVHDARWARPRRLTPLSQVNPDHYQPGMLLMAQPNEGPAAGIKRLEQLLGGPLPQGPHPGSVMVPPQIPAF